MRSPRLALGAATLVASSLLLATASGINAEASPTVCTAPVVAAHRGGDYFANSTARNFTASAAAGAKVWETDVRFTRTGWPVLLHDADLGEFGARGTLIANINGAQALSYRATDGSQIESLYSLSSQVLATPGQTALVELKVPPTTAEWVTLAGRLRRMGTRVWVASFDPAVTTAAKAHGYQTAQIDGWGTVRSAAAVRALGTAYESEQCRLNPTYAAQLKAAGVTVYAWDADLPSQWTLVVNEGVIPLTDHPTAFLAWYRTTGCALRVAA